MDNLQQEHKYRRIRLVTRPNNYVQILDAETNEPISGVLSVHLYADESMSCVTLLLDMKSMDIDVNSENVVVTVPLEQLSFKTLVSNVKNWFVLKLKTLWRETWERFQS